MKNLAVPLTNVLPQLVSNMALSTTLNVIDKLGRKITGQGSVRARKGFTLLILYEDIDDISKIVESLEKPSLLIDGAIEKVKHEIKKKEVNFFLIW